MMGWAGKWLDGHVMQPWDSTVHSLPLLLRLAKEKALGVCRALISLYRKSMLLIMSWLFFLIVKSIYVEKPLCVI